MAFVSSNLLVAGNADGTLTGYDVKTGQPQFTLLHGSAVTALAASPAQDLLAAGGADGDVKIWKISTGTERTILHHSRPIRVLKFSPDGSLLAVSALRNGLKIWNVPERKEIAAFAPDPGDLAFSPDGKVFASASLDGSVRIWSPEDRHSPDVLVGHTDWAFSAALSPDDRTLASAGFDGSIRFWDMATLKMETILNAHSNNIFTTAFSPDGTRMVSCDGVWRANRRRDARTPGEVKIWNLKDLPHFVALPGIQTGVRAAAFSPNVDTLATAGHTGLLSLWNLATARVILTNQAGNGMTQNLRFSPDGKLLGTVGRAGQDVCVQLWQTETLRELSRMIVPTPWHYAIAF